MNSNQNQPSPIIENIISQTHALLLFKIFKEIDQIFVDPIQDLAKKKFNIAFIKYQSIDSGISEAQLEKTLNILQKKIVNASSNSFHFVITKFMPILEVDPNRISQSKKMKPKVILPSTQDATETIEDRKDNTSKYFILNTFYLCLEKIKEEKSVDEYQVISQEIIESITDHLDLIYSTAVRYIAGQCLGGLTEYDDHFKLISTLLLEKVKPTSKKTERVAVTYEKALKYLKYGIANSVQANLTLIFLNNYAKNLRKIERGVHRKEACKTISQIFQKIFPKKSDTEDVKKKKKLILTNLKSAYVTLFENLLSSLDQCYKTVLKWSKKAKHMVFSYQCLIELLDFLQFKLINEDEKERAKIRDLLATISNSMKNNTNLRLQYLELAYQFYQHLSIEFIEVDSKNFQFMTKTFSVFLLPNMTKKMSQINQQEVNLIASIIEEMGSKKLDLTIEIIMEMMKHLDLRLDYKIALLKGLGMLTETHYEDVSKKKELFGLVANFLLETRKYIHFTFSFAKEEDDANYLKNIGYAQIQINEQLVSAAMSTFPCVLSTKDDENMKISRNLIELTLHDNREISNFAILGLQKMVSKDENQSINFFNFIFKFILEIFGDVGYFIDVNNKIQDNFATFLKLSQVMSLIIGSFQESLKTNKNIIRTITLEIWQALRIQFEGCCMLWLSIPEVWIGMEISRLMSTFHNQEFIQFEKLLIENEKKHRKENDQKIDSNLEISFLAEKCVNQLENLNRDQLVVFIHTNYLEHKFAFNWAWNLLAHYFIKARNIDIVFTTVDPYAEILRLIWNQFVYLCASVSIPEEDIPHLVLENIPQTRETGPIKGRRKTKVKSEEDMNSMSKVTRSDTMERSPQIHDGSNQGDLESLQDREKKSFDGKTELDSPTPFMATKTELFNPKHNTLLLKHFFNIAYRLVRTEKENIRTEAINSLVKMQSSSFEIFLSIVVDHEKQMGFGDNENKLEDFKIMEIPFYLKSYIVTLTARFLTQCQTELFGSLPRLNRLINELMLKWMASEEIAQMDSIHMHNIEQIMQIVRAYFEKLLEFSQQKIARKEADNLVTAANSAWIENQENMTALFLFLLEMLSESTLKKITNQEKKKLILGDSINTLSILMMFYQSHNQEMENRLLIGCAKVLSMGSMIYPDVKRVLVTFLQNNPAYFEAYFRYSFDLMCDDEFLKLKALCFFESLVINFTSDPIKWIENVGIPIHKLIALILIHVNNPEKPVRSLVHHLIISLSELKTDDKIHPGKDNLNALSAITHPNMHIYCNLSSGYFDSVSTIYSQMTPQILMEVAKFYKKFNYDMKYKVMELLIFWTRNYAAFLQTQQSQAVVDILNAMLLISRECYTQHSLSHLVSLFWNSLITPNLRTTSQKNSDSKNILTKQDIMRSIFAYLLKIISLALTKKIDKTFPLSLTKTICAIVSRADPKFSFEFFTSQLLNFPDSPTDPNEFYQFIQDKQVDVPIYQHSSILLLDDLIFENGIFAVKFLPLLLQHAFIQNPNNEIGNNMLYYMIHSIVVRYSQSEETRKHAGEFLEMLMKPHKTMELVQLPQVLYQTKTQEQADDTNTDQDDDRVDWDHIYQMDADMKINSLEYTEQNIQIIQKFVELFQPFKSNFQQRWRNTLLSWSVKSVDERLTNNCLTAFYILVEDFNDSMIKQMVIFALESLQYNRLEVFSNIAKIFEDMITTKHNKLSIESLSNIASLACLLLFSETSKMFALGLKLLDIFSRLEKNNSKLYPAIFLNAKNLFLDDEKSAQKQKLPIDAPLMRILFRAFTQESFSETAMNILECFLFSWESVLISSNNRLFISFLLILALKFMSDEKESVVLKMKQFSETCGNLHNSIAKKFVNVYSSYAHFSDNTQNSHPNNEFLKEFFEKFAQNFNTNLDFIFMAVKSLLIFTRENNHKLKIVLMQIVPHLLASFRVNWTQLEYQELIDIIQITSHSSSVLLSQESENAFSFIISRVSEDKQLNGLDFISLPMQIDELRQKSISAMKEKPVDKQIEQMLNSNDMDSSPEFEKRYRRLFNLLGVKNMN